MNISGIIPKLSVKAELAPVMSECGVGALMPWADKLWAVSYVSHKKNSGAGGGLYEIDDNLEMIRRPESRSGTYTNRMVHYPSTQLIIGPHIIDSKGAVKTIEGLVDIRICSTMKHLEDPENKVYMLGMEGELFELNVYSLEIKFIADLKKELGISEEYPHFKAGYTAYGRLVVANNSYDESKDYTGQEVSGRLAEWDGKNWTILEKKPFYEVSGCSEFQGTIFATGWDQASAILKTYMAEENRWITYRLPKGSHTYDHMWSTEWPRIRSTEHERFLLDCHGIFYELTPWAFDNHIWGIQPISKHLQVLGDFCSFRGMLVLGADNASSVYGRNTLCAEPQSGMWFGKTDDLWQFGKPSGWGGPLRNTLIDREVASDPYLMTGFDKKVVHLCHDLDEMVNFSVEVDFLGNGLWKKYDEFPVSAGGYKHHEFPVGFSAHWVRFIVDKKCKATTYLTYS